MKRLTRKGFTLIELIVVIVILGILAALAVPAFQAVLANSRASAVAQTANSLGREAHALAAFTDSAPADEFDLVDGAETDTDLNGINDASELNEDIPTGYAVTGLTGDVVTIAQSGDATVDSGELYVDVPLGTEAGNYTPVTGDDVVEQP